MPKAPSNPRLHSKDEYHFNFGRNKGMSIRSILWLCCGPLYSGRCRQDTPRPPSSAQSSSTYAHLLQEPRPRSLKERRQDVKDTLPEPVWEECLVALRRAVQCQSVAILSSEEEVQILESILTSDLNGTYAKRPADMSLLNDPSSVSMTALRNLLNEVEDVSTLQTPKDEEEEKEEEEGLEADGNQDDLWWVTYDADGEAWDWSDAFRQKISSVAKEVQKEHGNVGLRVARWAVRGKYAQTVCGITYGRGYTMRCEWYDGSMEWLIDACLLEGRRLEPGMMFAD
ncbi:uncharacterized protein EV420DRAFT_1479725 [Desarmillaria tabescens]|uniref:Uncharacterized protein n=1 Tax=Armillaria tabescens TaxID=1929756 RepID=A0AA39KGM8_ARMTA|nr:uncharacterized protein EV420DRAFT_1479725 [Desarmillaria tabescens]KAK0458458.1 hypothetical protein EV420DRAFT_1479725 [Desarmillaria tabescens]